MTSLEQAKALMVDVEANYAHPDIEAHRLNLAKAQAYALVSIAESLENLVFVAEERIVRAVERLARS